MCIRDSSTILIGNNIVNITASTVGTVLFTKLYAAYGPTVSTVVLTLVVLCLLYTSRCV